MYKKHNFHSNLCCASTAVVESLQNFCQSAVNIQIMNDTYTEEGFYEGPMSGGQFEKKHTVNRKVKEETHRQIDGVRQNG